MSVHAAVLTERSRAALSSVEGKLGFTQRSTETQFTYAFDPPDGQRRSNIVIDEQVVRIADARPVVRDLSLDVEGFALVSHRTAVRDFWDEAQTLALGHPEAAEIVRAATGARRVVVYDHTLRRRLVGTEDRTTGAPRQPATRVHVDQTVKSGPQRVRDLMSDQAEDLLRRRAAIINVWRPIGRPALDWPLALADASSVDPADLIPSELRFEHRTGEIYGVAYTPTQRWFQVSALRPDETLLIKCWDSDETVARFAPHTGFEDPTTPPGTPPRESIEFRTIAFFD
ncbi:CmcJ/NvfI family oxidoreductase [Phenylobacterium sp.]|uniref:CmcJ/NvfI family oxidoreductase n=1 Tax=Phenylobacterium sp. TaxID=1871053 RepID=UPI0011F5364E|nr:CmcJ/NvfI family oxidoreductase [Phenylobacterium sp.]THD61580.1 MAG: methyltransferase [Phenylobacterium sp.]